MAAADWGHPPAQSTCSDVLSEWSSGKKIDCDLVTTITHTFTVRTAPGRMWQNCKRLGTASFLTNRCGQVLRCNCGSNSDGRTASLSLQKSCPAGLDQQVQAFSFNGKEQPISQSAAS